MPSPDDARGEGGTFKEEVLVRVTVDGTTFVAEYEVVDGTVVLVSADFGEASAGLDGLAPEAVAARLLREMAEAAMTRGEHFMRDGETNIPGA